jgi:hypothetical protein
MTIDIRIVKLARLFLPLLFIPALAADGLRIKSGALSFASHSGRITVEGTSNVQLDAAVNSSGGFMGTDEQCGLVQCEPGTTLVTLRAFWSGLDLSGMLRLRGRTFVMGTENADGANGTVEFDGAVEIPAVTGPDTIQVSAPFTMSGVVTYGRNADGSPIVEPLSGAGTAMLTFEPNLDQTAWRFVNAEYVFDSHR